VQAVEEVFIHPDIERYIIDLVSRTRQHSQAAIGASPRGSLALFKLSRAWAALEGRNYVLPDDVKCFAHNALGHRLIMEPSLWGTKNAEKTVIDEIIQSAPVPVLPEEYEK
jgi:MoxR-like ATPase